MVVVVCQARLWSGLPNVTFGVAALCAGALCVLLPDTSRADLPDRVPDAETLPPASPLPSASPTHTDTAIP